MIYKINQAIASSLSLRILLMTMLFILLFGLVTLWLMTQYFSDQYQKRTIAEQTAINVTTGQMIDSSLLHRRDALLEFTQLLIDDGQLKPKDQLQAMLDERIVLHHLFNGGLMIMNQQAQGWVDSPIVPGRVGTDYSDRPHVQWVAQHLKSMITNPFLGRRMQTPIFIVNSPILSESNQLLGYMIGIILLEEDRLFNQIHAHFKARQDRSFIIDPAQNLFVTSTDSQFVFQPIEQWLDSSLVDALAQKSTSGFALNMNGDPIFYSAHPLEAVNWVLVSTRDKSVMIDPLQRVINTLLFIGFLMLLVGPPFFYWLLTIQFSPLRRAAEQLKAHPNQPILLEQTRARSDEVHQLIHAFNHAISYQQAHQQSLEQAKDEAERAHHTKSRFLAVVSHEVRNPLAAIMGLAEIGVGAQNDAAKQLDCLRKIALSGEGLKTLLDDVLDLSKIDEKKLAIQSKPFALSGLVEALESQYLSLAHQKGLEFKIDVDDELLAVYAGDRQRLVQVLSNLLSNALKFTEQGRVTLKIQALSGTNAQPKSTAQQTPIQEKVWLGFSVRDSGVGMTAEQQQKLFQPFQQGDDSISQFYGGTGLGLAISQDLVKLMGGDAIGLETKVNQGSHFFFSVPMGLCTDEQIKQTQNQASFEPIVGCSAPFKGVLLVVEDVEVNRLALAETLTSVGFDCYLAEDGQEAIEIVNQQKIDLILMDKQMPVMNGFDATLALRAHYPDLPIVGISADTSEEDRFNALSVGMNEYLAKPVSSRLLIRTICKLLKTDHKDIVLDTELSLVSPDHHQALNLERGQPWLDLASAMHFFDHQPKLLRKTLEKFGGQQAFDQFETLYITLLCQKDDLSIGSERLYKNWQEFNKLIHQLNGSCSLVGAQILSELLTLLQQDTRFFRMPDADFIDQWRHSLTHTRGAIDQVLDL